MSRSLASFFPENGVKSDAALRPAEPRQEIEARQSASAVRAARPTTALSQFSIAAPERLEGPGEPLASEHRAEMETHLGHDFSDVRVHTGPEAAESADRLGARAYTFGNDIVFGSGQFNPQSSDGQELLAHELTHTAQQAGGPQPLVQMDPKGSKGGLGSQPPNEPFLASDEAGAEDAFVLFTQDHADLGGADSQNLRKLVADHKGPVTIAVHGYASEEGGAEYNLNLAAHRAAAVKAAIKSNLPKGSIIALYSNGATTLFGPSEKNRRAGISITDGVAADQSIPVPNGPGKEKPKKEEEKSATGIPSPTGISEPGLFGPYRLQPPPYLAQPTLPPLLSTDFDWAAIAGKYRLHGQLPDLRDIGSIEDHLAYSYRFFRSLHLTDEQSKELTNVAVPFAVNLYLAQEHPNVQDEADAQFKRAYPNATTVIIPFSSILDAALRKALQRKKSLFEF